MDAPASTGRRPRLSSGRGQALAAVGILVLLAASGVVSYRQKAPAANAPMPGLFTPAWWLKPIEFNSGLRPGSADLHNVFFVTPQVGWAIGYGGQGIGGTIIATTDGGANWHRQASNATSMAEDVQLWAVYFNSQLDGWVMGDDGTALHTKDGGVHWVKVRIFGSILANDHASGASANLPYSGLSSSLIPWNGSAPNLISLTFVDSRQGWVVGTQGTILHTEDGGNSWTSQNSGTRNAFRSVAFPTALSGWAVGNAGTVVHTEDGGKTWMVPQNIPQWLSNIALYSVTFSTPQSGWIVGGSGTMLHTEDGGKTWQPETPPITGILTDVAFVPPQSLWVVGSSHQAIYTSQDGGKIWKDHSGGKDLWLRGISFPDAKSGWVVGANETVLHTRNGGATWSPQSYRRLPAPWFFLVALLSPFILMWTTRPIPPQQTVEYIESLGCADAPVDRLRFDVLGYGPLVTRLARFIQNPRTSPPLVMAIQAPWGMGKSSVMSMLRSELKSKRSATCVWFNAWHHQKEDQLLAYLMDAIQRQVAPSWFSAVGLRFRFNLLRVRMFSSPERFLLTIAALAVVPLSVGFGGDLLALVALLGGGSLLAINLLRTFSADPQKLLSHASSSVWKFALDLVAFPSLQGKTDVRFQFMRELSEVVEALLPQRLVIFLDDLDRCRPEQVVDILEAINFLSSAAPCFIFVGADYRKVETLAGQHFETIALQEAQNVAQDDARLFSDQPNTVVARMEYARNYMLKIVNMRLDLPRPTPQGIANLIRQTGQTDGSNAVSWQRYAMVLLFTLSLIATIAIGTNLVGPSGLSGTSAPTATVDTETQASGQPGATIPASGATATGVLGSSSSSGSAAETAPTAEKIDRNAVGVTWSHWLQVLIPLLVGVTVLVRVRGVPKEMEKAVDSQAFSDALNEAAPSIQQRCGTPREVRRFQNYLRFLAAWDDSGATPHIENLEAYLVGLAACGIHSPQGGLRTDLPPEAIDFFIQQCHMLGLDPATFRPAEEKVTNHMPAASTPATPA